MTKLILIDGHSLAYRAFFALPPDMANSQGELTNATYGFLSMLLNVLRDQKPTHIAVAFDVGRSFRQDQFEEYKATRERMPDELRSQIERIQEMVETFNIPIFTAEGYEADDVLATLARQAATQERLHPYRHRRSRPLAEVTEQDPRLDLGQQLLRHHHL